MPLTSHQVELELVEKVGDDDVVNGKLDTKGVAIGEEQDPGPVVGDSSDNDPQRVALTLAQNAGLLKVAVVAPGRILWGAASRAAAGW